MDTVKMRLENKIETDTTNKNDDIEKQIYTIAEKLLDKIRVLCCDLPIDKYVRNPIYPKKGNIYIFTDSTVGVNSLDKIMDILLGRIFKKIILLFNKIAIMKIWKNVKYNISSFACTFIKCLHTSNTKKNILYKMKALVDCSNEHQYVVPITCIYHITNDKFEILDYKLFNRLKYKPHHIINLPNVQKLYLKDCKCFQCKRHQDKDNKKLFDIFIQYNKFGVGKGIYDIGLPHDIIDIIFNYL